MRISRLFSVPAGLLLASSAFAGVVTERWGQDGRCRHKGLEVARGPGRTWIVRTGLSQIRRGTRVHRASLQVEATGSPSSPVLIYAVEPGWEGAEPPAGAKPLQLVAPRFSSFDATEAVRAAVKEGRDIALLVKRFENWQRPSTALEVTYEGEVRDPPPQVTGLKVFHRKGQTYLTWTDIDNLISSDRINYKDFREIAGKGSPRGEVKYRIYRSDEPITARGLSKAARVDEVGILSGYDKRIRQLITHGEVTQGHDANVIVPRYVIEDVKPDSLEKVEDYQHGEQKYGQWLGKQLPLHTGLYVHVPAKAAKSYYAVLSCVNGVENTRDFSPANSLSGPVVEEVGPGEPVLYRKLDLSRAWGNRKTERHCLFYVYWAGPPRSNLPLVAAHLVIGVEEPDSKEPRSMLVKPGIQDFYGSDLLHGTHLHDWRKRPHVVFQVEPEVSYTAAIGFHSSYRTLRAYSQGVVEPYTVRVLDATLTWARRRWNIDPGRITTGNAILACHLPDLITYAEAGGYQSILNYLRSPLGRGLPAKFGPYEVAKAADGSNGWELLNVERIIRRDPASETPYLWCPGGKGPGHEMETGWAQNPRIWRALIETKRPFAAGWGGVVRNMFGHPPERWREMKYDHNVPAFGNCSLDDVPGTGSLFDGDLAGQINGYLWWDPVTGVDEAGKWELVVYLVKEAPEDRCTVDITPRRLKAFKAKADERCEWTNFDLAEGKVLQSGTTEADRWGLVTLPQALVTKGRNRITISR